VFKQLKVCRRADIQASPDASHLRPPRLRRRLLGSAVRYFRL